MPFLADARFGWANARFLLRRLVTSLREDDLGTTWQRIARRLYPAKVALGLRGDLYQPADTPFAPFALPRDPEPSASIIIPVYNQARHTLACLRAIAEHSPAASIEVIVVDDGSNDETVVWMPQIEGLRYSRRTRNEGFIAACNGGAAQAHGKYLVFLNNDTVPQPGWLDALLATFDLHANVGLAGAQLLYPDGRLQEAGGVVFSDGSAWNYGRFESPYDPRFGYVRDADYCSGAAIAIPRALFESLGGFDTRYTPAYYEDTDLAFAVRAAGKRVLYQPEARVVHKEGTTAGTDTSSGTKAYQARNAKIFAEKWKRALASQLLPDTTLEPANLHRRQLQVLVVDALPPQPDRDSGSMRLLNLLRLLHDEGAHACFLPLHTAGLESCLLPLQRLGVETWYKPWAGRVARFLQRQGARFDVVMLSRHYVATPLLPLVRRHAPQARIVFDTVDLHGLREQRAADLGNDAVLRRTARATTKAELAVAATVDATVVVSAYERDWLRERLPDARVEVLSNLHEVRGPGLPFAQRHDLVFVGGFRHPPNVDAVLWFANAVFPPVRSRLPGVRFHCIGGDCPPEILALSALDGVVVHGHVPDIAPYMDGARVALAPLRYGAGVKGKVNLSMAHGQPVVATSCAVEGMHLQDRYDVLVADDAAGFADRVVELYRDEALWNRLSANGLDNVRTHFSLEAARGTVRRLFFEG
ncbi:glycosyltransferase [Pseudoxanthomonas sangjuensis]|uniref:glycosyltransferase n=1 Tax=Pseudoxanthomonas sangjuensis TaxID=1503750 RepID=UPI0013908B05|nr:glycosyltransferase [Pseudoxanthomonas sangjuensis]KAF1713403.1 glycosyl transferase [Pseudoxanthomonas sangjuensis]